MTASLHVTIAGIGLLGPGFDNWDQARLLLRDPSLWQARPSVVPAPSRLPATERRRAGVGVKASVVVADQACAMAGIDPSTLATVFTSSTGEPANCHALCEALATPDRMVSPTRFTNSVHNVAAGYWHIAVRSTQPSTSLAAFDASAGAGLLEACAQCVTTQRAVLLVACDLPYPEPLHSLRPVADVFAFALVLLPASPPSLSAPLPMIPAAAAAAAAASSPALTLPGLALTLISDALATPCTDAALEQLRRTNPAARALPLLQALAGGTSASLVLEAQPGMALGLQVAPAA